jgi:multidrug transporter EmrE-like cation transporter
MDEPINKFTLNGRLLIVILFGLLLAIVELFAQYNLKYGNANNKQKNVYIGLLGYILVGFILYSSYTYERMGEINLVWSCISFITVYYVGNIYFNEPFNKYTIIAIILAIMSIYFAHLSDIFSIEKNL